MLAQAKGLKREVKGLLVLSSRKCYTLVCLETVIEALELDIEQDESDMHDQIIEPKVHSF